MTRSKEAWLTFFATRVVGVMVDAAVVAVAYFAAVFLRFDFATPPWGWSATAMSFIMVCVVHILSLITCGCYRLSWRRTRGADVSYYLGAMLLACVILTVLRLILPNVSLAHIRPPYSITLIAFFLGTIGIVGVRVIWSRLWAVTQKESDLLARGERAFDHTGVAKFFAGRTVLVTGAGGSIGSEIVRQVVAAGAKRILMVERSENALYEIHRAMRGLGDVVPLMIDVNDEGKMAALLAEEKPSVVLHAAAYKHVPMVEANSEEGWRNNFEATKRLAELAKVAGVARFVLISTDKAVNPVSVMGKTKLAAEQAIMALDEGRGQFCAVRFGNVLGSSGSVVPLFREQIAKGGPVTITHPEMVRYFMTIQEAVSLVLQAASRSEGAIYTLDMGQPVRIVDLAESMIAQAGYRPYVDIGIIFTGIRPGEKLFEEIDVSETSAYRTDMAKIYITRTTT